MKRLIAAIAMLVAVRAEAQDAGTLGCLYSFAENGCASQAPFDFNNYAINAGYWGSTFANIMNQQSARVVNCQNTCVSLAQEEYAKRDAQIAKLKAQIAKLKKSKSRRR